MIAVPRNPPSVLASSDAAFKSSVSSRTRTCGAAGTSNDGVAVIAIPVVKVNVVTRRSLQERRNVMFNHSISAILHRSSQSISSDAADALAIPINQTQAELTRSDFDYDFAGLFYQVCPGSSPSHNEHV